MPVATSPDLGAWIAWDGPRRFERRWKVERLFAWIFRIRHLVTRDEEKSEHFLGLVQLACARILWRQS